jgi:hypothetical protein
MGSGLEPCLGLELESVPRLAACGRPGSDELGAVGSAAAMGPAAAGPTVVGTRS